MWKKFWETSQVITARYQPIIFFYPASMAFEKPKVVLQLLVTGTRLMIVGDVFPTTSLNQIQMLSCWSEQIRKSMSLDLGRLIYYFSFYSNN